MRKSTIFGGIIGFIIAVAVTISAAPVSNVQRSYVPEADNQYYVGTTSPARTAAGLFVGTGIGTNASSSILQNLGIGTSSPGTILSIQGFGNLGVGTSTLYSSLIVPSITATSGIAITGGCYLLPNGTCLSSGGIPGGSDRQIQFNNASAFGGSDQFIITSGGLVGIGTGTPGTILGVTGDGVFSGQLTARRFIATSTTDASIFPGGVTITCTACITDANVINTITLDNITQITTRPITSLTTSATAGNLFFSDGTNPTTDTLFTWNNTNNWLGLGTNTPSHVLTVRGSALFNGTSTIEGGGLIAQALFSTTSLNLYTGSNIVPRLTIDSSGNIGVGTTGPGTLLSVGNTSGHNWTTSTSTLNSTGGVNLANGGCYAINGVCVGGGGGVGTINSGTTNRVARYSGATTLDSTDYFSVDQTNSRIGIGTDTPSHVLTVRGPALFNGTSTFEGGGIIASSVFSTSSVNVYSGSNAAPRVTVESGGNVGVGTTGPSALLSVGGALMAGTGATSTIDGNGLRVKGNLIVEGNIGTAGCNGCGGAGAAVEWDEVGSVTGTSTVEGFDISVPARRFYKFDAYFSSSSNAGGIRLRINFNKDYAANYNGRDWLNSSATSDDYINVAYAHCNTTANFTTTLGIHITGDISNPPGVGSKKTLKCNTIEVATANDVLPVEIAAANTWDDTTQQITTISFAPLTSPITINPPFYVKIYASQD